LDAVICSLAGTLPGGGDLRRLFGKIHGMPPHHFMLKARMECAGEKLRETLLPIKEIASAVGLPDVYHFSKQFKARFHLPPATCRNEMRSLYSLISKKNARC